MKPLVQVSVRELVTFVLQSGDLGGGGNFVSANRALEGTRGHQRLQKSRPSDYQREVAVCRRIEFADFVIEIKGRIDGVVPRLGGAEIEEIKTTARRWTGPADPLHWAQVKIYGAIYAQDHQLPECELRITYLDLSSGETVDFREHFSVAALAEFFDSVVTEYAEWIHAHRQWCALRDESIRALAFPFKEFRAGQRAMAVAVYKTLKNRGRLFVEAPTGIGKTVSALFPAIKSLGEGRVEKIFYLTAKTIGRAVAEKTLQEMRGDGLRLRALTLTARDKICFNNGAPCDLKTCPYALGYYDRVKAAVRAGLAHESLTRDELQNVARAHQVCPFELSLDVALWVDVIVCDYNYAFDPSASLKRFFGEEPRQYAILVDEAHNLVERAREMFSAELDKGELSALAREIAEDLPACGKALRKLASRFTADESWMERGGAAVSKEAPTNLAQPLKRFLEEAELWLAQNNPSAFRPALLELYFRALAFQRVLDSFNDRYLSMLEPSGRLRLYCVDPSALLAAILKTSGPAVFLSATLRPLSFFRESLGGDPVDSMLQLDSPFARENLLVLVNPRIATRLRARESSFDAVAELIAALVEGRTGNYLVYFPSYEYLARVLERFRTLAPSVRVEAQTSGMSEPERERFLAHFHASPDETLVGFAVLGGIFGEGIDLVGERLIGVAVVGVGLPQICLERDLVREHCQARGLPGFDFAYAFPGMNRVLQAVGRVIRSEMDRGVVLLIDDRFRQRSYRDLFPAWWSPEFVESSTAISETVARFWNSQPGPIPREL